MLLLFSHVWVFATPQTAVRQVSLSSAISQSLLKLMDTEWWCYITTSSSVIPFSSCLQSFPASGSFPKSWLFASGGQSIGVSTSASVLPMNIQGWFPSGLTGLISLQSSSVQFSHSVLSDSLRPRDCSTSGFPVHHQLPELAQNHVRWVHDAIQPSHHLSFPSPPAFNLSQHQGLSQRVSFLVSGGQSIGVSASASVLPMNIQD